MKTYFLNDIHEDICQNCSEVKILLAETASSGQQNECLTNEIKQMRVYIKGAIAALTQNKTYPADIEAAKGFLNKALMGS